MSQRHNQFGSNQQQQHSSQDGRPSSIMYDRNSMFRASSIQSLNTQGYRPPNNPLHGSVQDVSMVMQAHFHRDFHRSTLLTSSTPLGAKFAAVNGTLLDCGNGAVGRPTMSTDGSGASHAQWQQNSLPDRTSSMFPQPAPLKGDPRPLATKEFQDSFRKALFEFLSANGFQSKQKKPLTEADLSPISIGTLSSVFEFLMAKLIGDFTYREGQKMETILPFYAEQLGYPYANQITTNALKAPNVGKTVTVIAGFLDWLREEVQLWLIMTSRDADNGGLTSMFCRVPQEEIGGDDVYNTFREARLSFIVQAHRAIYHSEDYEADINHFLEEFQMKMDFYGGDLGEELTNVKLSVQRRGDELRERMERFKGMDAFTEELVAKEAVIAQKKREIDELKAATRKAEEETLASQRAEQEIARENTALRQKIDQTKSKVAKQRLSKAQYEDKLKLEVDLRQAINQAEHEIVELKDKTKQLADAKKKIIASVRDLVAGMRTELIEMALPTLLGDVPYYDETMNFTEYVQFLSNKIDEVITHVRAGCGSIKKDIDACQAQTAESNKRLYALVDEEKTLNALEKDWCEKLADLAKRGNVVSNVMAALEGKKRHLLQQLETGHAELEAVRVNAAELNKTVHRKKKTVKKIQAYISDCKVRDQNYCDEVRKRQEVRRGKWGGVIAGAEEKLRLQKEVESSLINGMADASRHGKHEDANEAA
ncbi:hypothetical protein BV898_00808 [Hypsibius exemplaris]|uniref:Kinetochore protein NDC80 n=1 Tax=Hypsibius exemplaris TaxID=2072580 RepID=A0A1W0XC98_HYPEX|nr:hypothetical protein BV898_00808 [Hypsibius exemplaris]